MHGYGGDWGMGFMTMWWFFGVIVIALVVWVVARAGRGAGREGPEDIVKRRYAAGEIDRDTYERMLEDLRRTP